MNFVGSGSGIWAGLTNPDLLQMENAFQRTLQGPEYGQTQKRQEPSGRAAPQVSVCTEERRIFSRVAACKPAGQANALGWELAQEGLERLYTEELRPRGLPQAFRPSRCSLPGVEAQWPQENWVGGGKAASQA